MLVCEVVNSIDVVLHWQSDIIILVEHLLVHFMETWLPCSVSHHHYACVALECVGIAFASV